MGGTISLAFSTFFTVVALILVALAFSTDYWVDMTLIRTTNNEQVVQPPATSTFPKNDPRYYDEQRLYYDRHFGLFRVCFDNSTFLRKNTYFSSKIIDRNCLKVEYEIPRSDDRIYSNQYWAMIHLMRCVVAFFIVAMLFLLTGAVFGSVSCWASSHRSANAAGAFIFVATFFAALAMAFFHGVDHIRKNKLTGGDPIIYYSLWPADVKNGTIRRYAWSYVIAWVGVGMALLAAILYIFTAWYIKDRKRENELYETAKTRRTYYDVVDAPAYTTIGPTAGPEYVYVLNGKPAYATARSYNGPYAYEEQSLKVTPNEPWDYK